MTVTHPTGSGLTAEHQRFFRDHGYLVGGPLFTPDNFAALKEHFERKWANLPEGDRPEDMDVPHFTDPALFRWLMDPGVLDLVESLLGPDIAVFTAHFFCKPAGDGKSVPWHTDAYFWRDTIDPATRAITIWLAIDPSTVDNGCMTVIPGSHRWDGGDYRRVHDDGSVFDEELDPTQVDGRHALPVELAPNHFSVHAGGLVHGSERNLSSHRRCGFTMRYISTDVRFNHDGVGDRHQIFLARGADRAGNVYADPTVPHPELVRSRGRGQNFVGTAR